MAASSSRWVRPSQSAVGRAIRVRSLPWRPSGASPVRADRVCPRLLPALTPPLLGSYPFRLIATASLPGFLLVLRLSPSLFPPLLAFVALILIGGGCVTEEEDETVQIVSDSASIQIGGAADDDTPSPWVENSIGKPRPQPTLLPPGEVPAAPPPPVSPRPAPLPPEPQESPQQKQIRDEITLQLPQVQRCYERELRRRENLSGQVTVAFTVTASGGTEGARILRDTLNVAPMNACILQVVARWRFSPQESGPIAIEYPIRLKPQW